MPRIALAVGDTITAVCAAAQTSADPKVLARTSNMNGDDTAWVSLNGVTAVTLATGANQGDRFEGLSLTNTDTGAITVTLKHVVGGTGYTFGKYTLQVSDTLILNEEVGAIVLDVNGQEKTAAEANIVTPAAVTATTGGGTTGLIPAGRNVFATVTSDSANKQISLPAGTVGDVIQILVGATGCELIASVAADKVNDVVVGATNEAALTAENLYVCKYVATNKWVVVGYTKLGAVQSALVPDAL